MNNTTLCFVAGKSGGHIIPCLTLAHNYGNNTKAVDVLFFSAQTPLDKLILATNKRISIHVMLPLLSIYPRSFLHIFAIIWHIMSSFLTSCLYLYKYKPTQVITTGGVVAIPVCFAAFILRIPIVLYSLDAIPGKAIKVLTPLSSHIMVCFKDSQKFFPTQKCTITPFPLRYTQKNIIITQQEAQHSIGLDFTKKTVVILGGSQGSLFLNSSIKQWISSPYFNALNTQVIHQTGSLDTTNWSQFYSQYGINAHVFSYHSDLTSVYMSADLIICRAGAGTLFEVQFFKKRCLVIPLKTHTTSHQIDNARTISEEYPLLFQWMHQDLIEENPTLFFSKINELLYE